MKIGLCPRIATIALLLIFASIVAHPQVPAAQAAARPASALSIPQAQLLQPEALDQLLRAAGTDKPLVLQVGSHILYAQAHIPGSEYAGPGTQPAGLQVLQERVTPLPRNSFIVLYCGCCPWDRCPNLAPAFQKLRKMGFSNVKVLYLADNFGANWASKGYKVEKGR